MEQKNVKVLISCHRQVNAINNSIVNSIAVGAHQKEIEGLAMQDNLGENISHLNGRFCELTAQYYAWKNIEADYYGFFHYRRYLSFNHLDSQCLIKLNGFEQNLQYDLGLDEQSIQKTVQGVDLIVPYPFHCVSVYRHFKLAHRIADLDFCLELIKDKYPHFEQAVDSYINGTNSYQCNMFVAKKEIFFDYCNWLFDILFAFESQKDYSHCSVQQLRAAGFLAERLFGIYLTYLTQSNANIKILNAPIVLIKDIDKVVDNKIKAKYSKSLTTKITDLFLPRGNFVREVLKKIYNRLKGKV
ncbi:MAG: DUF4422 domain-containing protein [Clostridiales bacterium]|jgi:hypothetical protein|nr:DUF4422 domain-containing protein [Clostridiales bacterium]